MFDAYAVNTLEYDEARCVNCDRCIEVCPHEVFERGLSVVQIIRYEACIECGACVVNCPTGALKVEAGVGCAAYLFMGALMGDKGKEAVCGC